MRITSPKTKVESLEINGNLKHQGTILAPINSSLANISSFDETQDL
jgi:hypothetical protein